MFPKFIYKNKDSYEDFGIIINKKPPTVIAEKDIEEIEIQGRDGNLTIDYETRKSYVLPLECKIMDENRIEEVKSWLMNSDGDLIFNWDPDYKYQARIVNKIDISQSLKSFGEFPLLFKVQPYKKSVSDNKVTLQTTGTIFNNTGNTSKPILKVFGTGNVSVTINSQVVNLTNIVEYVTIDSNLEDAFRDLVYKNTDMVGKFPVLEVGNNNISWSGTVTKIEIDCNFRFT